MLVSPAFRQGGYGRALILHLANTCLKQEWQPVCGCVAGNEASRRTLEQAGFAARHSLLLARF